MSQLVSALGEPSEKRDEYNFLWERPDFKLTAFLMKDMGQLNFIDMNVNNKTFLGDVPALLL